MTDTTNVTNRSGQWLLAVGVLVLVVGVAAVLILGVDYLAGDTARPFWLGAVALAAPVGLSLVLGGNLSRTRHRARLAHLLAERRARAGATRPRGSGGRPGARSGARS